jgi:flagellar P-ring protein precursor FlgI
MAEAINGKYPSSSQARDGATVRVKIPDAYQTAPMDFIAQLYAIEVTPDTPARIILNEKTGTIVTTSRIKVSPCAVAHANVIVKVSETLDVSQPSPFAQTGTTVTTPSTQTQVTEERGRLKALPEMPTVERVAAALNEMGITARDMMSIFQAMKQAGALQAELVIR